MPSESVYTLTLVWRISGPVVRGCIWVALVATGIQISDDDDGDDDDDDDDDGGGGGGGGGDDDDDDDDDEGILYVLHTLFSN